VSKKNDFRRVRFLTFRSIARRGFLGLCDLIFTLSFPISHYDTPPRAVRPHRPPLRSSSFLTMSSRVLHFAFDGCARLVRDRRYCVTPCVIRNLSAEQTMPPTTEFRTTRSTINVSIMRSARKNRWSDVFVRWLNFTNVSYNTIIASYVHDTYKN